MEVKSFILRLKARKLLGHTVQNCAYFLKYQLKRKGNIVQGYCITQTAQPERLQYYWVEDENGTVYDVAYEVACMNHPSVSSIRFVLTKEAPERYESDEANAALYKQYTDDPKTFWTSLKQF